jgi:hypothetical protein
MDTALFYHKYSDRTLAAWHIAVDKNARKTRYNLDCPAIEPYYWEEKLLYIGQSIVVIDDCRTNKSSHDLLQTRTYFTNVQGNHNA